MDFLILSHIYLLNIYLIFNWQLAPAEQSEEWAGLIAGLVPRGAGIPWPRLLLLSLFITVPAGLASLLFLKHSEHALASVPFHLLFLLSEWLLSQTPHFIYSLIKSHPHEGGLLWPRTWEHVWMHTYTYIYPFTVSLSYLAFPHIHFLIISKLYIYLFLYVFIKCLPLLLWKLHESRKLVSLVYCYTPGTSNSIWHLLDMWWIIVDWWLSEAVK